MTFRFRRTLKIVPGVRLNVGKRGVSASVRGAHVTVGKAGTRSTVGIPGTGASWTKYRSHDAPGSPAGKKSSAGPLWSILIVLAVIVVARLFQ